LQSRLEKIAYQDLPRNWPAFWLGGGDKMDARRGVLVNMAYNLGVTGLLSFKKMLSAYKKGAFVEAAQHMLDSKWAKQVGDRAKRLAEQMRSGEWQ
jgi:lysozyme